MSISLKKYVDITSGVGAAAAVSTRELIGRFFSTNALIPTGEFLEFESATEVADYFGSGSDEYARAVFYFGWVSKLISRPRKISFARWANAATAPQIFGAPGTQSVATWAAISSGAFTLEMGTEENTISGLNFGAVTTLAGVAAIIQAAIRLQGAVVSFTGVIVQDDDGDILTASAVTGVLEVGQEISGAGIDSGTTIAALGTGTGGAGTYILSSTDQAISSEAMTAGPAYTLWSLATVAWDSVRGSFNLEGGATGAAAISVTAGGGGSDIAAQLGWLSASTILSDGAAAQTITEVLIQSADASTNFGSFTFMPTLTEDQIVEAAEWNLTRNNEFMYSIRCTTATASSLRTALEDIGGVTITLSPLADEYPEQVPMMILAATNYAQRNTTMNYMFNAFNLTASVATDADYETYKDLEINFYGQTQTAGQIIEFYQEGVMQGLPVDPADQNTYANEIWFKDASGAAIMTALLALPKIPANSKGRAMLLTILQGVINQALFNGTISVGKPFTDVQKAYIAEITGDTEAWRQVQNIGYWIDIVITPYVEEEVTKYKAVYTLVYSKDDIIRKVEGRDILI